MNQVKVHSEWPTPNLFGNCLETNQTGNYHIFYLCTNAFKETIVIAGNFKLSRESYGKKTDDLAVFLCLYAQYSTEQAFNLVYSSWLYHGLHENLN